jgi:DNA polymerase-3 subunit epsilon
MTTNFNTTSPMHTDDITAALALLDAHPDFRVLRSLPPAETLVSTLPPVQPLRVAAILDCETTGLSADFDEVIELAVQRVRFDGLGRIIEVGQPRSWLQQPSEPLDPEIIRITGLTDDMLAGQKIDIDAATKLIGDADVVIAHNAAFDRPFVDRLLPGVSNSAWACSMSEVDWRGLGFEGRALNHLVYQAGQSGFFFGGHRAATDVLALLHLLAHPVGDDGGTVLGRLIAAAEQPTLKVSAVNAPYDRKDLLRRRRYSWDADHKRWWREIGVSGEALEREFLAENVYRPGEQPVIEQLTWRNRYRGERL